MKLATRPEVKDDWSGALDVEVGVGVGLTNASDNLTFKVILSRDLNKPRKATK